MGCVLGNQEPEMLCTVLLSEKNREESSTEVCFSKRFLITSLHFICDNPEQRGMIQDETASSTLILFDPHVKNQTRFLSTAYLPICLTPL